MAETTIEIAYLADFNLFWGDVEGAVTLNSLATAYKALLEHPDYSPEVDELVDFSKTSIKHMKKKDFEIIRLYMQSRTDRHNTRSALIVNTQLEFGLSR